MDRGTKARSKDSDMLRIVTSTPRRPVKWALGLTLGFGLAIFFLRGRPTYTPTPIGPIIVDQAYNDQDVRTNAGLCQPSPPALSNSTYACLGTRPIRLPPAPSESPILPHIPLPQYCLDAHFAAGVPCSGHGPRELDVVWIWVNGSDPLFQDAIEAAEQATSGVDTTTSRVGLSKGAKLYREHDELRYSLRSVLQHFGKHTSNFHLFTTDVGSINGSRFGILPQWLDFNSPSAVAWHDGAVNLTVVHHSQVFENLNNSTFNSNTESTDDDAKLLDRIPIARIEYRFRSINDDFFFARDLTPTDFYSSGERTNRPTPAFPLPNSPEPQFTLDFLAYGIVLRMDPGLGVPADEWPHDTPSGEWGPLKYSNWLLSQRFGHRQRPYMIHVSKTISPTLLQEISSIWRDEFLETASHRFRGQKDVYTTFLHGHYVVERWRELLLWSWIVGRIGRDDDTLGEQERYDLWDEVGGNEVMPDFMVNLRMRSTLEKERVKEVLKDAGEEEPAATQYIFSSLDGYPYAFTRYRIGYWPKIAQGVDANIDGGPPDWSKMVWARCRIVRSTCFPEGLSASEMFVHVMYDQAEECGDCIIQALLNKSGRLGLDAFLPPDHRIQYSGPKGRVVDDVDPFAVPRLPLSKTPGEALFKLKDVLGTTGTIRVRDWVLRAMERYRFVVGETPVRFGILASPLSTSRLLRKIDATPNLALLTINDDVKVKPEMVDWILRQFLDRRWQFPSAWEGVRHHGSS